MEDTKKCPYCGEEILAVAKKCKHCGEWLDEEVIEGEVVETEEEEIDSAYDDSNWDWLYKVMVWGVLLAVAFFTLPSEEKQTERMMEELRVLVRKDIKNCVCEYFCAFIEFIIHRKNNFASLFDSFRIL